ARAQVERRALRERDGLDGWDREELLRRPVRPVPGGLPQPDALADPTRVDPLPDRLDRARAVLVGDDLGEPRRTSGSVAGARLPVGRVHARDPDADEHLAGCRLGVGPLDELEDGRVSGLAIDDGSHELPMMAAGRSMNQRPLGVHLSVNGWTSGRY